MQLFQAEIIRSNRKTMAVQIRADGTVLVRAPLRTSDRAIRSFLKEHERWIETHLEKIQKQLPEDKSRNSRGRDILSEGEIHELMEQARQVIPERVAYYASRMGVTYGTVTIRCQKTRWGSCSAKGNLNFNCLLMLAPAEVLDSVVVHELCHRIEMNHSRRFYEQVYRYYPEYDRWHSWLKQQGHTLIGRTPR